MSRPPTHPTATGDRRGNEASHAACVLASTARRAGRTDLRIMGDVACNALGRLQKRVAVTSDPLPGRKCPDRIPLSEPRINLADVTIRLRKAAKAAKAGDWTEAENNARVAIETLEIGWIDRAAA